MHILLTIFRAKQVAESSVSASKVTPIIIIEEPESFLHPVAQAEFGRVLQNLSEEFGVQIIVTTHSPYLLSLDRPESNVLLERKRIRRQIRQTERVDTSGEKWMDPFALALGIRSDEFKPWRDVFFGTWDAILLVEGKIDREYFELLRDHEHGDNRLKFVGDILPYGGKDALKNQAVLAFLKEKCKRIFITFDLDSEDDVGPVIEALGLEKKKDYLPVGMNAAGKRCVEGLLPDSIVKDVYSQNPDIVAALGGTSPERRKARDALKKLLLERFRAEAVVSEHHYDNFYPVVRVINRAFGCE